MELQEKSFSVFHRNIWSTSQGKVTEKIKFILQIAHL